MDQRYSGLRKLRLWPPIKQAETQIALQLLQCYGTVLNCAVAW
jgi:hypothetical protein